MFFIYCLHLLSGSVGFFIADFAGDCCPAMSGENEETSSRGTLHPHDEDEQGGQLQALLKRWEERMRSGSPGGEVKTHVTQRNWSPAPEGRGWTKALPSAPPEEGTRRTI